jgi:hypothetical protein
LDAKTHIKQVETLSNKIREMFVGKEPDVIGATLADLLATLLAGFIVEDDEMETDKLREEMLALHIAGVRKLIPISAREIHKPEKRDLH